MDGSGLKIQWLQPDGTWGDALPDPHASYPALAKVTLFCAGRELTSTGEHDVSLRDIVPTATRYLLQLVDLINARQKLLSAFGDDVVNVI